MADTKKITTLTNITTVAELNLHAARQLYEFGKKENSDKVNPAVLSRMLKNFMLDYDRTHRRIVSGVAYENSIFKKREKLDQRFKSMEFYFEKKRKAVLRGTVAHSRRLEIKEMKLQQKLKRKQNEEMYKLAAREGTNAVIDALERYNKEFAPKDNQPTDTEAKVTQSAPGTSEQVAEVTNTTESADVIKEIITLIVGDTTTVAPDAAVADAPESKGFKKLSKPPPKNSTA
jgi:hypothetical protein